MKYSLNKFYAVSGITKQGFRQYRERQEVFEANIQILISEVELLREEHPGCGVEKMYDTLKPGFLGRDRFVELFMELGYRVRRYKNYHRTTYSTSRYFPNLIKGFEVNSPSIIWQSDITYIKLGDRFYYAVFILDVYTRKIVGYQVSDHMRATANMAALKMAFKENKPPQIHHSDRGSQYVYELYINMLMEKSCQISMGLSAQDNAYAERINQTIKDEYLRHWNPTTSSQLIKDVKRAVNHYNTKRIHKNLNKQTPLQFEQKWSTYSRENRPVLTIFNNEIQLQNGQH
ncbi:IS3 family transposase [Litoribacter populi]|uniref:IS3 family transposase n=1 Tax=Litoribacter populi TaxID=2598460 RepID=UPI00117ECD31|nr:IS3 family transposase [Litoribacter populi]